MPPNPQQRSDRAIHQLEAAQVFEESPALTAEAKFSQAVACVVIGNRALPLAVDPVNATDVHDEFAQLVRPGCESPSPFLVPRKRAGMWT
jgi:hypothetical protein